MHKFFVSYFVYVSSMFCCYQFTSKSMHSSNWTDSVAYPFASNMLLNSSVGSRYVPILFYFPRIWRILRVISDTYEQNEESEQHTASLPFRNDSWISNVLTSFLVESGKRKSNTSTTWSSMRY